MSILVTGGCGYIGSHTIVDLIQNGFDVVSVDDCSRSDPSVLSGIETIAGKSVRNYKIDMKCLPDLERVFSENVIVGAIHFAAYKSVVESVSEPLMYYENNLLSLTNLLRCAQKYGTKQIVFSSSCTVYGSPDTYPVTEKTALNPANCPYGATKQMGEQILQDFVSRPGNIQQICLLRYFNPAGAHPSLEIGESPRGGVQSLTPAIMAVASGRKPGPLYVFGSDYNTRDGSCIRDFIHVCDIAHAHTRALLYMMNKGVECSIFNLGAGAGVTVFEAIAAFEQESGTSLNYTIAARRPGDVEAIFADNSYACKELGWNIQYTIRDIMRTAWQFEQKQG
jgi:UDP-glucose 4-epimerase